MLLLYVYAEDSICDILFLLNNSNHLIFFLYSLTPDSSRTIFYSYHLCMNTTTGPCVEEKSWTFKSKGWKKKTKKKHEYIW